MGKERSKRPGVELDELAKAICERFIVNNSELTNLDPPPEGTKRYPSLEAVQTVAFFPGAAIALVREKSCIPNTHLMPVNASQNLL